MGLLVAAGLGEVRRAIAGPGDDAEVYLLMDGLGAAIAEAFGTFLYGTPPEAAARLRSVAGTSGALRIRVAIATTAAEELADTEPDGRG